MIPSASKSKLVFGVVGAIIFIGTVLRLPGMFTELWFDEIRSIRYVQSVHSAWQVLWSIHSDNKHHLIWLWIWLIGPHRADAMYRVPSIVAGVLVLPILFRVVQREFGLTTAFLALLLSCFCYPLIFYSSEARGYALVVLLAVCAYALAPDRQRQDSSLRALLFSIVIVLGFLAHLTFVYIYAGLLLWTLIDAMLNPRWMSLLYHLPALGILCLIYIGDVSQLHFDGGQAIASVDMLRWTIAMTFGTPIDGQLTWICGIAIAVISGIGFIRIHHKFGRARSVFFLTAIVIAPVFLTILRPSPYLATRYFLVCFPFILMLLSIGLSRHLQSMGGKILAGVVLAAVILQSGMGTYQLHVLGRGHARDCLVHISSLTPSNTVNYQSERPAMDQLTVNYYAETLPRPVRFIAAQSQPADWWILDLDSPLSVGPPTIHRLGIVYKLDSVYPSGSTSGLTWDLYKRAN